MREQDLDTILCLPRQMSIPFVLYANSSILRSSRDCRYVGGRHV
jgi:hypothetical protein